MPMTFEQQPRESNKAFAAFKTYLELGAERSLVVVAEKHGKSKTMIERWSRRFDWPSRVQAHAAHLATVERQAIESLAMEKAVDWNKVHEAVKIAEWQRHKKLIALADDMLVRWEKNKAKCGTLEGIARVLELATKLGRLYTTTNPGGVGHAWYRSKFVAPMLEHRETETRFIPARVGDNAFNNPEYRRILESLTGWQKRAWLDGSWDIAAGQFFTLFRRDVHVVEDFDDSRAVEWFAALDYGHVHYTVCLLGCRDGDGNTFIVDEHAERLWLLAA